MLTMFYVPIVSLFREEKKPLRVFDLSISDAISKR